MPEDDLGPPDHLIAAKNFLLTTRDSRCATEQVGTGRTGSGIAGEFGCDWHTLNDALATYGRAFLAADKKRLNETIAIGLEETSFVQLGTRRERDYATTVADVEHHQIIDILPNRHFVDVAAGWTNSPAAASSASALGPSPCLKPMLVYYLVVCPKPTR